VSAKNIHTDVCVLLEKKFWINSINRK